MVRLYGDSRVWTFRAMDGAAARGRLDIIQHLHYTRNEGCSPAAFTEAASHGHVEVVRWLYSFYQQKCWTCIAIKQAGMYGHIKVVKFLKTKVPRYLVAQAARFAAENNHMEVVDTLLADDSITTFTFAITCGQTDVVKLLLERGYINKRYVIPAMLRTNLFARTTNDSIRYAFRSAAQKGNVDIIKLLLDICISDIGSALRCAVKHKKLPVVRFLIDFCKSSGMQDCDFQLIVNNRLQEAVISGDVEITKLLADHSSQILVGCLLSDLKPPASLEIAKVLAQRSDEGHVSQALLAAGMNGWTQMVKTLLEYADQRAIDRALKGAVQANQPEAVKLLLDRYESKKIEQTFESAVIHGHVELVQILLPKLDYPELTVGLEIAALYGQMAVMVLLKEKCDLLRLSRAIQRDDVDSPVNFHDRYEDGSDDVLPSSNKKTRLK
ncbi:Hypothetical protein PHPALM_6080 [Phytophthora palmivora]|uniref:Uncharacterized protein n=1 Tax=Phytophthora palmivora TaxID=4796 RepID=A0A2P4YFT4_9STRA|nr:Hypothetical protein PHPALM_6080 [Phytophthora palmivora]